MKFLLCFTFVAAIRVAAAPITQESSIPLRAIVPQPLKVEQLVGRFPLDTNTKILAADPAANEEAEMLASWLRPATGLPLPVESMPTRADKIGNAICLTLDPEREAALGKEGYTLEVLATPIVRITAANPAGLFYGGETLRQLLPPAIFAKTKQTGVKWEVPCCKIEDQPRFSWRGLMLDSSRHFQSVGDIKRWLDGLAMHKLNVFHWHLTDSHGWRFESKKHPLLTQVGAWREQPPIGRYGGFYSQQEMRDIVAYAAQRHITIVPEIEMPGHALAAIAAYPSLTCDGSKTVVGYFYDFPMRATVFPAVPGNGILCVGREATYQFLEGVLTEVMGVFPSPLIHVGGDEVNVGDWNNCADCRATMKANNLANGHKLQAYFMGRIEKFLNAHGRKLIGWDEIIEGGLSPSATVMSWRGAGGGIQAAKTGHDAVMSPEKPLYFDHRQSASPQHPPGFGGAVETLREVYDYNPAPQALSPEEAKHILGAQANLWTCATETEERLQLFAFPRLCALAEITWCPPEPKNYEAFQIRLGEHLRRFDVLGINYWKEAGYFQIGAWLPNPEFKGGTAFDLPVGQPLTPGPWTVSFHYQKGADALTIDAVALLADGTVVATEAHEGIAGAQDINNQYTLTVPSLKAGAKLILRTKAHVEPWAGGGNGDSTGVIFLSQPVTTVRTYAPDQPLPAVRATMPALQNRDHATYDWPTRHLKIVEYLKTTKPEIVMIGDSITHYWAGAPTAPIVRAPDAWKQAFGDRIVANLGCGWDRTENVLWRIDHGELDGIDAKQVVLLIGTNNLELDTPEQVVAGIDAICRRIHEKLPATRILVLGILPRKDEAKLTANPDTVNYLLQTRLHPRPYVDVLDLGNKFRNPNGTPNETLLSDGLHPNTAGYAVLAENLSAKLNGK